MKNYILLGLISIMFSSTSITQSVSNQYLINQIDAFKKDPRGPYKDIRWFCADGSISMPKEPCPKELGPGKQHARYKDVVETIASKNHIFLGQILASTSNKDFWDSNNRQSRLKQYQIEKYLKSVDDGWILRRAQYYRGAVQAEDEEAWGIEFYTWLLDGDKSLIHNYFLIRQSMKDIPHKGDDNLAQLMRSQSKVISDLYPAFTDIRVKIHGQPEIADIEKVKQFKISNAAKLSNELKRKLDELEGTMTHFFEPIEIATLSDKASLVKNTPIGTKIKEYASQNSNSTSPASLVSQTAGLLLEIRKAVLLEKRASARIQLLDLSLKLEEILFKNSSLWQPVDLQELLDKSYYLSMASAGAGYLEMWEWREVEAALKPVGKKTMTLEELFWKLQRARSVVEWSSSMIKATYQDVVDVYAGFEPKAISYIDDKIRGSIVLNLGKTIGDLGDVIASESSIANKVLNIPNQSSIRGLNPGYAFGELVIFEGPPDDIEVVSDKIYIFQKPPSDLKPVAGIATVAEGNLVSHVQLLARNLGIPNAALSDDNLKNLQPFNGQKVFYAVSNKGNVILKAEKDMTKEELALFAKKTKNEDKIAVPVKQIQLNETRILNMRNVDANDSGKTCGPKAANLGQLKKMFPDKVVEGIVIPFGIFREHMDQPMPEQGISYWAFLINMFEEADKMRRNGIKEGEVEKYQLNKLETLSQAIRKMSLKAEFLLAFDAEFQAVFNKKPGELPVFLRSDTNMEDLKDFSGAGLNLTLFNVLEKNKILQGIKDVWASPYSERSFKWRQKYLLNPENVFPSILVIPSVDVDYSGVLITKGINSGNNEDLTIAFSRGAGGAVDGQSAESYEILLNGNLLLLAPAREPYYKSLPASGGTEKKTAAFSKPILNDKNITDIIALADQVEKKMLMEINPDYQGAYDVELGFKDDKLWLFQIRPFVENKKAVSSNYLDSITPKINKDKIVSLSKKI